MSSIPEFSRAVVDVEIAEVLCLPLDNHRIKAGEFQISAKVSVSLGGGGTIGHGTLSKGTEST